MTAKISKKLSNELKNIESTGPDEMAAAIAKEEDSSTKKWDWDTSDEEGEEEEEYHRAGDRGFTDDKNGKLHLKQEVNYMVAFNFCFHFRFSCSRTFVPICISVQSEGIGFGGVFVRYV